MGIGPSIQAYQKNFEAGHRLLSMQDYLKQVELRPREYCRDASTYILDALKAHRQDADPKDGRFHIDVPGRGRLAGHHNVQERLFSIIENFVRAGRADRMILLHGPNGSAKTSLVASLFHIIEDYGKTSAGKTYRFNWVFPHEGVRRRGMGFGGNNDETTVESFAYLSGDQIQCRIVDEYKDHPILLLPHEIRQALFDAWLEAGVIERISDIPEYIRVGQLSSKNKAIFDALLGQYQGDLQAVFRHIQIERFEMSTRYHVGLTSVEPQMHTDGFSRQISADRAIANLPIALQHIALYETGGALSNGHRGAIEYNDLFKRPLDAWKYLLVATEERKVSLNGVTCFLDALLIATSNDLHYQAFQEHPDWASFKGRVVPVAVPYLLRHRQEVQLYAERIPSILDETHCAPHTLKMAALWAVLTRLKPVRISLKVPKEQQLVRTLTPIEKTFLYDSGKVPARFSEEEKRLLLSVRQEIEEEYIHDKRYEGSEGVSYREMRHIILNSVSTEHPSGPFLSLVRLGQALMSFAEDTEAHTFLQRKAESGYYDAKNFVHVAIDYARQEVMQDFDCWLDDTKCAT